MESALNLAKWFIKNNFDVPSNTRDGNMKLQKMLYFSQLIHLAQKGEKLFKEDMYAFKNGTVVESVRLNYQNNYYSFVKSAADFNSEFNDSIMETLETTEKIFGDLTASELSDLNHEQYSWQSAYENSRDGNFHHKELSIVSVDEIIEHDLEAINELISTFEEEQQLETSKAIINGKTFYYQPQELTVTEGLIRELEAFDGKESVYSIYYDEEQGLVIY